MEVVGALASIVQLLDATAKLIDYLKDVRTAEKQISTVRTEIEVIRNVLLALERSAEENPKTFHGTLTVLNAKDGILFEISSFITDFKEKLEAKPGRKLGRKISWPFDKSRFQQDLKRIQRYKTILICALLNDSMFVCHFFFGPAALQVITLALLNFSRWNHTIIKLVADIKLYLEY